jgi:aminoglycoside N3'-acetyltransferase
LGSPSKKNDYDQLLGIIEKCVGTSGNIVLPAFTYSFGSDLVFDLKSKYGIKEMGYLSLKAFEAGFYRSNDPMFSLLVQGPFTSKIDLIDAQRSFGPGSVFSFLFDQNVSILNICTGAGSTLIHEIEYRLAVAYRFEKTFFGSRYDSEKNVYNFLKWQSYVRHLNNPDFESDFALLSSIVKQEVFYTEERLGKGVISSYKIQDMFKFIKKVISIQPDLLIRKGVNVKF